MPKESNRFSLVKGIIQNNVVCVLGLGMPVVIAASTSVKKAFVVCVLMLISSIVGGLISVALSFILPRVYRVPIVVLASMTSIILTLPVLSAFTTQIDDLGIYVPLIAVNSVLMDIIYKTDNKRPIQSVYNIIYYTIGFTFIMLGMSALREVFGNGTIWGLPAKVISFKITGVQSTFFGFILIGMLIAFFRLSSRILQYMVYVRPKYAKQSKRKGGA